MKNFIYLILVCAFIVFNCNSPKPSVSQSGEESENLKVNDTVKIANEELEYEIIIIDPGYATWLASRARERGFYTQQFMETRNNFYVIEWNQRVRQPLRFSPQLYELPIDYDTQIDYGYEVNYKLYNYFIYFQLRYNQRLGPFNVRI